ncbi:MAG: DUF2283 domain-containing protein [Euryarchaeota archaeon]|nr:MAG: hypothetical protein C5S47_04190 [ANME-2 cluster archaeon]MEA1866419.1 DUF2283 domain-containing protein [Euryarchaeota archaeon]
MDEKLRMFFDKKGDSLDISLGEPREAISREIGDDILMRIDPETDEVLGFTILNFEKRFERTKIEIFLLIAKFAQPGIKI